MIKLYAKSKNGEYFEIQNKDLILKARVIREINKIPVCSINTKDITCSCNRCQSEKYLIEKLNTLKENLFYEDIINKDKTLKKLIGGCND